MLPKAIKKSKSNKGPEMLRSSQKRGLGFQCLSCGHEEWVRLGFATDKESMF